MSQLLLGCFWFPNWAPSCCEPLYLPSELFSQFKSKTADVHKPLRTCWFERADCSGVLVKTVLLSSAAAEFVAVASVC